MLLDPFPPPADIYRLKQGDKIYIHTHTQFIPATFVSRTSGGDNAIIQSQQHGRFLVPVNDIFHPDDVAKGIQK